MTNRTAPRRVPVLFAATILAVAACFGDRPAPTAPGNVEMNPVFQFSSLASGDVRTVFGPVTVTRQTGTPETQSFALQGFGPTATLRIVNGGSDGKNRVSSGSVSLDGMEVVSQSEFGTKVAGIEKSITLRNSSTLAVRLTGTPGDRITISIDGTLATEAPVSPAGGTVQLLGQQVQLTLPPGAVPVPIQITAEPAPSPDSAAAPGTTIDMGPDGTTFDQPVTLSIAFDPGQLYPGSRPRSLRMFWWNVDHWERLPNQQFDAARGIVSAQTTHFSEFSLLPDTVDFCPGNPAMEQDLRIAVNHVAPDGTILVCNGTFAMSNVRIDKPLTLKSANPGGATLTDTTLTGTNSGNPVLLVTGINAGLTRFTDIAIVVSSQGIRATAPFDQIVIDNVTFSGSAGGTSNAGVVAGGSPVVTGAKVEVINSHFHDLLLGVWPVTSVEFNTRNSTFDRFTGGAIDYSSNGTATGQSYGEIVNNTLTNCAASGCMRLLTGGALWVHHNTMTALSQPVTLGAITLTSSSGSVTPTPGAVTIEDNIITSATTGADVNTPAGWQFQNAILISDANVRTHLIRRNTITNSYAAIQVQNGDIDFRDNVMSGGFLAFRQTGPNRSLTITRNDFTGLLSSFTATNNAGSYQCNWWGSVNGPTSPPATPPGSTYSPWALAAIANTANACNPAPGFPLVRVCSTGNGTDVNFTTAALGISFVSPGGTVEFCNETFPANNIPVNKPMTITAEAGATPTIDAGGNVRALNIANVAGAGPVVISKLRFINSTSQQINIGASPGTVQITQNDFLPPTTNPTFGVSPGGKAGINLSTSGTASTVTIDHNTFTGGDIGVTSGPLPLMTLAISYNTFSGTLNSHVSIGTGTSPATSVVINNNTMSDCGLFFCINTTQPASIQNNQMTARLARRPNQFIQVTNFNSYPGTTLVSGNMMTGLDLGTGARSNSATYPVGNGVGVFSGTASITGNTFSTVAIAILSGSTGLVSASDNVASVLMTPLSGNLSTGGAFQFAASRNDFVDYFSAVLNPGGLNLGTLNIRCNWWGQSGGPSAMPSTVPGAAYAPWATSPIAGTANACDPSPPDLSVVRVCSTSSGPAVTVATAAQAVSLVNTGGEVRFCTETHALNNVIVNRPMTITSEGPGMATISAGGNNQAFSVQQVTGTGPVTFSHLIFTGGISTQISLGNTVPSVVITQNEFHPTQTNPYGVNPKGSKSGVAAFAGLAGVGSIAIDHNAFIGGDIGIIVGGNPGTAITIAQNSFTSMVVQPISVSQSTLAPASMLIDGNTFTDCSDNSCIFVGRPTTITNNIFLANIARPINYAVFVQYGSGGPTGPTTISNNSMTGDALGAGSRFLGSTYPIRAGAVSVTVGSATVTGNTITRAASAIVVISAGGVTATDNVITTTANGFNGGGGFPTLGVLTANWNDLSDVFGDAMGSTVTLDLGVLNIRCNWWGSAAGPATWGPNITAPMYTPIATAPIANQSHAACTP